MLFLALALGVKVSFLIVAEGRGCAPSCLRGRFLSIVIWWFVVVAAVGKGLVTTMGIGHQSLVLVQWPWQDGRQFTQSLFAFLQEQFLQCTLALHRQHMDGILQVPLKSGEQLKYLELSWTHQSPFCHTLHQQSSPVVQSCSPIHQILTPSQATNYIPKNLPLGNYPTLTGD